MSDRKWYVGAMNDGRFIIDTPPRPSTDEVWHDRPDGPSLVLNVVALTGEQAQAIADAHNAALGRRPSTPDGRPAQCPASDVETLTPDLAMLCAAEWIDDVAAITGEDGWPALTARLRALAAPLSGEKPSPTPRTTVGPGEA